MIYLRRLWSRTLSQTLLSPTCSADLFRFLSVPHHGFSFCFLILHPSSAPWTSVGPRTVTAPPQSFQHPAPPFSPANPHSSYTYSDNSFTGVAEIHNIWRISTSYFSQGPFIPCPSPPSHYVDWLAQLSSRQKHQSQHLAISGVRLAR